MSRFHENHELVKKIFNLIQKGFNECDVQSFNDIATYAINIIYKVSYAYYV